MATTQRFLARKIRDVTTVNSDDLACESVPARVSPEAPKIIETADARAHPPQSQVICVASGKGGTGKTVFTTNLAVALSKEGLRVLVFDADLGLANAHLLLGASPEYDISSVFSGEKRLADIVVDCLGGVRLIAGGSGFSELCDLKFRDFRYLAEELKTCEKDTDVILVDLSAGISPQVMRFLKASHDVILVTTPDVTAMLDAYATVKSLFQADSQSRIKIVVNRSKDRFEAVAVFKKIQSVAQKSLGDVQMSFFGWLPHNWYVKDSVAKRHPVVLLHPKSFVSGCFRQLADRVMTSNMEWKKEVLRSGNGSGLPPVMSFSTMLGQMIFA